VAGDGIGQRARHRRDGRLVKNQLDAAERAGQRAVVANVGLHQLDVLRHLGQVLALTGEEIVDHAHAVAAGEQRARQRRPDEPGAAGDETRCGHGEKLADGPAVA
jgi:hypothetical protein